LGYRVLRGSTGGGPAEEIGSTAEHQFVDSNVAPGKYEYRIIAAFLPHSRVEYEKRLRSQLSELKFKIQALSEIYGEGGRTASYGEPVTDKRKIEELSKYRGKQIPPSQTPSLLLQTIPSRPVRVEIQ